MYLQLLSIKFITSDRNLWLTTDSLLPQSNPSSLDKILALHKINPVEFGPC